MSPAVLLAGTGAGDNNNSIKSETGTSNTTALLTTQNGMSTSRLIQGTLLMPQKATTCTNPGTLPLGLLPLTREQIMVRKSF